jgi:hypothetical protein
VYQQQQQQQQQQQDAENPFLDSPFSRIKGEEEKKKRNSDPKSSTRKNVCPYFSSDQRGIRIESTLSYLRDDIGPRMIETCKYSYHQVRIFRSMKSIFTTRVKGCLQIRHPEAKM